MVAAAPEPAELTAAAARESLPAFQARLARRLAQASRQPPQPGWLALAWRGLEVLLPLADTDEVTVARTLQPLPHARAWVLGVAALRAGLVPVVDWAEALERVPPGARPPATHWVIWHGGGPARLALCADRLPRLLDRPPEPAAVPAAGWRRAWRDAAGVVRPELDAERVMREFVEPGLHQPAWAPQRRMEHG